MYETTTCSLLSALGRRYHGVAIRVRRTIWRAPADITCPCCISDHPSYAIEVGRGNAGCWRLQVSSGMAHGTLIMWVVGEKG
jgi:hypothetical protein